MSVKKKKKERLNPCTNPKTKVTCSRSIHSLLLEDRSFLCPPRIRDICKPLLNAWLKSIRVWNSDTNGNQARKATGVNKSNPITIS